MNIDINDIIARIAKDKGLKDGEELTITDEDLTKISDEIAKEIAKSNSEVEKWHEENEIVYVEKEESVADDSPWIHEGVDLTDEIETWAKRNGIAFVDISEGDREYIMETYLRAKNRQQV